MQIFLTGYMGSGKSTLGKRLASKLEIDFLDLDDYFEQKYRTSISLFFERFGEDQFRKLEHEVLKEVIDLHHDVVVSTGGGTPCFFNNMALMNQHGTTIYLRLPAAVLAKRLSNSPFRYKRPKLKGLDSGAMLETITEHLEERKKYYINSELVIDVFGFKSQEIVEMILKLLHERD